MNVMKMYFVTLLAVLPAISFAQETLADLQKLGARRLTSEELNSVLVGTTASGKGKRKTYSEVEFHPNGRTTGAIFHEGKSYALTGTYSIDSHGRLCVHYDFVAAVAPYEGCMVYYTKDMQYFLSYSDTDPKAEVYKRVFKK